MDDQGQTRARRLRDRRKSGVEHPLVDPNRTGCGQPCRLHDWEIKSTTVAYRAEAKVERVRKQCQGESLQEYGRLKMEVEADDSIQVQERETRERILYPLHE